MYTSKNNSAVSRSSYVVNKKFPGHMHLLFSKLKVLFCKSSHLEVLFVKGVLKICSIFTGEHPC